MENIEQTEEILKKKQDKKRQRRIEKIMLSIGITSVVFIVASYAWFIGTTEIAVSEFELSVKSSEGLTISLDGISFNNTIEISEDKVTTEVVKTYATHKNHWVGAEGLIPISTVGEINEKASVLNLYSKTSITSLNGGYKLRTDLIGNVIEEENGGSKKYTISEQDGYVVFDMFIKNQSGSGYIKEYDQTEDEGIYLINDSAVTLVSAGADSQPLVGGDGIENSIRLAFMQIGRVNSNDDGTGAQAITCTDDTKITGLCNKGDPVDTNDPAGVGITWNIWEPNDVAHNDDSIQHFSKICKKRTNDNTYDGSCDELKSGEYFYTYAANSAITSTDNINIYDGINGYNNISEKLTKFNYYTDSEKISSGSDRIEFFYLAPNSITKIRVYIYLEGQDVDNYDLGIIGKKISISFGFTKDKFDTLEDIQQPGNNEEENDDELEPDEPSGPSEPSDSSEPSEPSDSSE